MAHAGYAVLLLYAGLKSVPDDVFEAAGMDGANGMQKLVYIRIPLLKTQLLIVMIVLTLSYFNNVELPMSLTGGGPGTATTLISLLLYGKRLPTIILERRAHWRSCCLSSTWCSSRCI